MTDRPNPFWEQRIALAAGLIINGAAYIDKGWTNPDSHDLGFDGTVFTYRLIDSTTPLTTNNLWAQGDVGPEYRDQLPDNALFIAARRASATDVLEYIEARAHHPVAICECGHERPDHAVNVGPCTKIDRQAELTFDEYKDRMTRRCRCDAYSPLQS